MTNTLLSRKDERGDNFFSNKNAHLLQRVSTQQWQVQCHFVTAIKQ